MRDDEATEGGTEHPKLADVDPAKSQTYGINEETIERLLIDYQEAAEDARYRDRLLHYTHYVTIVVLGLLLNATESLFSLVSTRLWALAPIGAVGIFVFGTLLVWSESFREARNACWARQDEIESYLHTVQPGVVLSNESVANRLNFDYEYTKGENRYAGFEVAVYVRKFLLALCIGLGIVLVVGIADGVLLLFEWLR